MLTDTQNTPIEALERAYGMRVRRYRLRQGSGGTGRWPGGEGVERDLEMTEDATVSLITERRRSRPWGLAGGEPGEPGENWLLPGGDESKAERLPDKCTIRLRAGDVVRILTPGGAGTGYERHDGAVATRVLIIEDDEHLRTSLRLALEQEGNVVDEAATAEEGLPAFGRRPSDVVLVDIMLPGANGFDLCRDLRQISDVPILVLTARSDSHDVVAALEAGADDYVVKPAVPKELAARIRALLRRANRASAASGRMAVGDLEIEPDSAQVRRRGDLVPLTKTEFRLLCELARIPGRVLSREVLLERVWGYDYFGDSRLVDVHIRRLRRKVEDDASEPRRIVTVRGLGYKLEP